MKIFQTHPIQIQLKLTISEAFKPLLKALNYYYLYTDHC